MTYVNIFVSFYFPSPIPSLLWYPPAQPKVLLAKRRLTTGCRMEGAILQVNSKIEWKFKLRAAGEKMQIGT